MKGKLSLYPPHLLSCTQLNQPFRCTFPASSRLLSTGFAFTLCARCTWTLYIYRRAPCATKIRNSALPPRIRLLKITPNYVSLLANILASFFFNRLINAKNVKLKVIGGLKVLSIFFFFERRIRKIRKRKEYLLKNLFRETSGRMRL